MARLDNLGTSSDEEESADASSQPAKETGKAVETRKRVNPATDDDEAGEQAPNKRRQIVSGS